jgi:hypothetical protein
MGLQGFSMDSTAHFESVSNAGYLHRRATFIKSSQTTGTTKIEVFRDDAVPFIGALCTPLQQLEQGKIDKIGLRFN